jgi:alkylation response protein AidB-like acyl-CoA dehydrogenase
VDFSLGETQEAVIEAATAVLGQHRPPSPASQRGAVVTGLRSDGARNERLSERREGAASQAPRRRAGLAEDYDRGLWKELGEAGLLGLAVPEYMGGGGLGVLDTAVLLTEIGRQAAPVPALATLMMGVLPVARWAGRGLQQHLLTGVSAGDVVLTAAIREPSAPMPPQPATTFNVRDGTVSGVKIGVPYAAAANRILVPATLREGVSAIAVVDPSWDGVTLTRTPSSSGAPEYTLRLDEVVATTILPGTDGADDRAVADLYQLTLAGACCLADGAVAGALALTTKHVATRQQFGRPLATFQAVAQHIADVSIASRTLHLAARSSCWRLDSGREAGRDLDVAAYWLADQAPEALRLCHHLHGGTGMDISYPLHRYSALVKDLARLVGGADYRLGVLGTRVAEEASDVR